MSCAPDESAALFSLDRRKSTILRGVAILYVLLGHADYYIWGGAGGVALFLLLSGYGLDRSFAEKGLEGYWQKRILKVWLPCCIIGVLNVLALRETDALRVLCSVTGLDFCRNVDRSMWYVSFILLWYAAFYLISRLSLYVKDARLRTVLRIAALFLCAPVFLLLNRLRVWNGAGGVQLYVFYFPLGVVLSALTQLRVKERTRRLIWFAVFFAAAAFMFRNYGQRWNKIMALAMALQAVAPSQLIKIRGGGERALLRLGEYAYPIYLLEMTMLNRREAWLSALRFQPLIDLVCLLLTALFAFVFWEAWRRIEELLTDALERRRAKRRNHDTENDHEL